MVGIVRAGHVLKGGMNTDTTSACRQGEVDSDMTLHMSDDAADDSTPTNTVLALVGAWWLAWGVHTKEQCRNKVDMSTS